MHAPAGADARPIPPRFWWLKRFSLAAAVFVIAMIGVRIWWGHYADRRLQATIARYRAAGQPVTLEDFQTAPIPDEDNAAYYLKEAAAKIVQPEDVQIEFEALPANGQSCAKHAQAVERIIAANREPLRLLREARSRRIARWGVLFRSPALNVLLPHLAAQRRLAKLASVAAIHEHQTGRDAEAVAVLRDVLAQGPLAGNEEGFLISHLVGLAIENLAIQTLESVLPDLASAEVDSHGTSSMQPATRREIEAILAELLDEDEMRHSYRRSFYAERMLGIDTMQCLCDSRLSLAAVFGGPTALNRAVASLLAPSWKLEAVRAAKHVTCYAEAGVAVSWPAAQRFLPAEFDEPKSFAEQVARLLSFLAMHLDRAVQLQFRAYAQRRMAAIALAIRLYEIDHGDRPADLHDLVPAYLPGVPRDPFDPSNGIIRYRPDIPSPLLYSIGPNEIDEQGAIGWKSDGRIDLDVHDIPFYLNGDRPRRSATTTAAAMRGLEPANQPTSTQAVVDDEQVEDGAREQEE